MNFRFLAAVLLALFSLNAQGGVLARFQFSAKIGGTVDVELFDIDKPATVANFIAYVKSGAWHDCMLDRWEPGFVLQAGSRHLPHDPALLSPLSTQRSFVSTFPMIPFEKDVGRPFSNLFGTIAMARAGTNLNSAQTDWFFNLANNTRLDTQDGGYTVFAKTLRGTNVLDRFAKGHSTLFRLSGTSIPVYSEDAQNGFWIHSDITLLTAQIARVAGGNEISWDSVEGLPNIVEFTKTLPPSWQEAQTVSGTGARLAITNDPGGDTMRFYRVRIQYPAN
jgi:cyclophilin family peptidyl-prolyl cis-trans isomerase